LLVTSNQSAFMAALVADIQVFLAAPQRGKASTAGQAWP
jgi:hypothetical protein